MKAYYLNCVKLEFDIDEELNLYEKYNLTPTELFFVRTLLIAQEETDKYIYRFLTLPESARGDVIALLQSLQDKGVILKSYKIPKKGEQFFPTDVEFNKNVTKNIYKSSYVMGEELFANYPTFATINGSPVGIRSVSKKFDSLEDFFRAYGKTIKWNAEVHKNILELVNWGKENNLINYTLASFLIDRKWEELQAMKDGNNGSNINYNAVKLL